jgi:hypothetical protein
VIYLDSSVALAHLLAEDRFPAGPDAFSRGLVSSRKAVVVIAENFVGSARVEQWQRGTVAADVHDVLDQTLDQLVFTQFPFETLAKRVNDRLGERLTGALRQRSR